MSLVRRLLDYVRPYFLLVIPLVLGLLLLFLLSSGRLEDSALWNRLLESIGIALVTAFVIGVTIDLAVRTRISQDVFNAAFGYLFPAPLRDEIRWVYELKAIAEEYEHEYEIQALPEDPNKVLVRETITRVVKSLTGKEERFTPSMGIQEWFHPVKRTEIISANCTVGSDQWSLDSGDYECFPHFNNKPILHVQLKRDVSVTDERKAVLVWQFEEVRDWNDQSYSFFSLPSQRSNVNVVVPEELGFDVTFANRSQGELKEVGPGRYRLDAVLLPDQAIRLRWWRKPQMDEWIQNDKTQESQETVSD